MASFGCVDQVQADTPASNTKLGYQIKFTPTGGGAAVSRLPVGELPCLGLGDTQAWART
jgi:hypothetical protein